jgi:hypothetical protein
MAAIEFPRTRTQPQPSRDRDRKRLNAQVARMVNELLLLVAHTREFIPLRCECGVLGCSAPVVIPRSLLLEIRDDPDAFVVAPGHFVGTKGELLASDLTYNVIRYYGAEMILTTEKELAHLVFESLPKAPSWKGSIPTSTAA